MGARRAAAGRHRARRRGLLGRARSRAGLVAGGTVVLGGAAALTLALLAGGAAGADRPAARVHPIPAAAGTAGSTTPSAGGTIPTTSTASSTTLTTAPALARLQRLVAARSGSSTSVAAVDLSSGATAAAGAGRGMTTASAVKLQLLESLLLKRQRSGSDLSDGELASATAMIEHSDNGAAEQVFFDVGGHDAVADLEHDLGLSTRTTVLGDSDYWGLTTTSAAQQLVLLRNLVDPDGPLDATSRAVALRLMRHVETGQTWGVPVASTSGHPAVKNGWLDIDTDGGRWAVNSLGVVTVDGHTVLIAVMTQHNASYDAGVSRVESLVRATAAAVRS